MDWKNASRTAFLYQLERNLYELNNNYPTHWTHFINQLETTRTDTSTRRILDIGCGVGVYYKLCRKYFPYLEYIGYDYAPEAIKLAKETWNYNKFYVKDYKDIRFCDIENSDIIVANALCDVLPNGDDCLEYLMWLNPKYIILQRVKITTKPSYIKNYKVYGEIDAIEYYHNEQRLYTNISKHNYFVIDKQHYNDTSLDLLLKLKIEIHHNNRK